MRLYPLHIRTVKNGISH